MKSEIKAARRHKDRDKRYKAVMHFNKQASKNGRPWTVHYRGVCYLASEIECLVPTVSEWKPERKSNPRAFMTAQVAEFSISKNGKAVLK
jgi:hypothetical protein